MRCRSTSATETPRRTLWKREGRSSIPAPRVVEGQQRLTCTSTGTGTCWRGPGRARWRPRSTPKGPWPPSPSCPSPSSAGPFRGARTDPGSAELQTPGGALESEGENPPDEDPKDSPAACLQNPELRLNPAPLLHLNYSTSAFICRLLTLRFRSLAPPPPFPPSAI